MKKCLQEILVKAHDCVSTQNKMLISK